MERVLWTGGWDSTYRVLDLCLNKGIEVQPYYVLDKGRKSTPVELETMSKIKRMIAELNPEAEALIREHEFIEIDKIPEVPSITANYAKLRTEAFMGSQYDWLARYVSSMGLDTLDLCIHRDDKAEFFIRQEVELVDGEKDSYYKLVDNPSKPELSIFSYYHFPLLKMTKIEMGENAKKSGFIHIMEETWFCFNPTKKGTPCGMCNPCKYTREEGLGRRVPNPTIVAVIINKIMIKLHAIKRRIFS